MKNFLVGLLLFSTLFVLGQEKENFGIRFTGFVKTDIFYDSRQTVDAREGHFLLWPKNEMPDFNGDDINATGKLNILAIQTRLKGTITGPDALGAKTSGVIEGAFFGNIASDINGFRLRHAFVKLKWESSELLVGQFWHPMFVTACFPGTVSFNTGTPFQPFARNPQIRFKQSIDEISVIFTLNNQVDFISTGPIGGSRSYIQNAIIPELNLRAEYAAEDVLVGAGANFKTLMPRTYLNTPGGLNQPEVNIKTNEKISGLSLFGYAKAKTEPFTVKVYGILGQMMYSMTNLGGYAEKEIITEQLDIPSIEPAYATTDITYTPYQTLSAWLDVHTNGKEWQAGLFAGYTQNLGTVDEIQGATFVRGGDIDYVYRISPRLIYNNGKFRVAPELEYTVAAFATTSEETGLLNIDEKGKVTESNEVANIRFLIGVYYFF